MIYQINDSIPLTFRKIENGVATTGLSVTVIVYNDDTNATLLSSTALAETSGVYRYNWAGSSVGVKCRAKYSESGNEWDEFFVINDEESKVEISSGRST